MASNRIFSLDGRVAVVTGAGRGLGRVLAGGLVDAGASVIICDVDQEAARSAAETIGDSAFPIAADVTSPEQIDELLMVVANRFGRLDIWVNNAGIDIIEPVLSVSPQTWRRILDVDLTGAFFAAQAAARRMAESGGGSIINITSIAASAGIQNLSAYSAAKAGLGQLTRTMALELAPVNVRVNAIAPGYLENVMTGADATHADPAKEAQIRTFTPLGRRARLDELVGPVVFLASDAASYVTGATLAVDGGYTAI